MVFPVLHGGDGEDGHLQALLEVMGMPYALSGPCASALAMDKGLSKRLMRSAGIPTPDWLQVTWDCAPSGGARATVPGTGTGAGAEPDLTLTRIHERVLAEIGFPAGRQAERRRAVRWGSRSSTNPRISWPLSNAWRPPAAPAWSTS